MNADTIRKAVAKKNEELEYAAVRRVHEIINEIAEWQAAKKEADDKIAKLREEMKAMEVHQITETSILGG